MKTKTNLNSETMNSEQIANELDEMLKPIGSSVLFKTQEEFEKSVLSGKPLVLKI